MIVELDFVDGAKISIDRNSLEIGSLMEVNKFVHQACLLLLRNFATYQGSSPYAGITIALLDEEGFELSPELKALSGVHWIFPANSKEDAFLWRKIAFPAILNLDGSSRADRLANHRSGMKRPYKDEIREFDLDKTSEIEPLSIRAPARIVLSRHHRKFSLALLYGTDSAFKLDKRLTSEFPDEWAHIVAIEYNGRTIHNRSCSLNKLVSSAGWQQLQKIYASQFSELRSSGDGDAESYADLGLLVDSGRPMPVILSTVAKTNSQTAAAFILRYCDRLDCDEWNALRSADEQSWQTIFRLVGLDSSSGFVVFWKFDNSDNDEVLLRLSVGGASKLKGHVLPGGHPTLPVPKKQWWLDSDKDRKRYK